MRAGLERFSEFLVTARLRSDLTKNQREFRNTSGGAAFMLTETLKMPIPLMVAMLVLCSPTLAQETASFRGNVEHT
jgi:hypothetical protein